MSALKDLTGKLFTRLVVLERAENSKRGMAKWLCQCDCGTMKVVDGRLLRSGKTQSCGCLQRELTSERHKGQQYATKHGLAYHRLYSIWNRIKQITTNPNHKRFKDYGGRGIQMDPAWFNDAEAFVTWIETKLGPRPDGHSLDRINNDGNYEPGNLRWADAKTQNNNRRTREAA
jgi:hypothetical protein